MLQSLHIENIAVVRRADLEPGAGFTVMTGETGAGKSVILGALGLLLGARPVSDMIRSGCENALVSALFTDLSAMTVSALSEIGIEPDEEGSLEISRALTLSGGENPTVKAQARINGRAVGVGQLKSAAAILVNIHGQHENQSLLDERNHLGYLDRFAAAEDELAAYREKYSAYTEINRKISDLEKDAQENERTADMLRFQVEEITSARLKKGEEHELLAKRDRLKSAEKIEKQLRLVYRALYQNEKGLSACEMIARASAALSSLGDIIPESAEMAERLENFRLEIEDIALTADGMIETEDGDADAALDRLEGRLELITKLSRRYGSDTGEILAYLEKAKARLDDLENVDDTFERLKKAQSKALSALEECSAVLSAKRVDAARRLSDEIVSQLRFLDMAKVRFEVRVTPRRDENDRRIYTSDGGDSVVFTFSANPGEPLSPLDKIASGGELSRVMLAIKSVLADKEGTETVVYDEIDTGISGGTAQKVGIKLKDTARSCQVMCVTHSAQIAALADDHLIIAKKESDGRTETQVRRIDGDERVMEIARILGGAVITEKQTEAARELLTQNF